MNNPQIIVPAWITRDFIKKHENEYYFIYSKPVNVDRSTGQGGEILYSCCFPVPVRWSMCKSNGYFSNNQKDMILEVIDSWIQDIPTDKPIIPFPNIGCGGSRMKELAASCYTMLKLDIDHIKYSNIVYVKAGGDNNNAAGKVEVEI